jgi:hypothetical protein
MAALSNPKHEAFARGLASGKSADEAYAHAGFKPHRGNAARLRANEHVKRRVAQMVERTSKRAEWSAADRLASLKAIHDKAIESDGRIAIAAIAEANKMQGSYPPAQHRLAGPGGGPIPTVDLTNMSESQIEQLESIFGPLAGSGDDDETDPSGEGEAGSAG